MSEADEVFFDRITYSHVQYNEMKEFHELCKKGQAISLLSENEITELLDNLKNDPVYFSNDMIMEMIINEIREYTSDIKTLQVLNNIKIANMTSDESLIGRAYPRYYDGSYYIEIHKVILRRIRLLSDILAIFFMQCKANSDIEKSILLQLLSANLKRYKDDKEYNEDYNLVQVKMFIYEKYFEKPYFTDLYVEYSREIEETATALLLGHEVGHHYYGHTEKACNNSLDARNAEYSADEYGLHFSFDYLKSAYNKGGSRYDVHQFVGVYIPMIASSRIENNIDTQGKRHPSIKNRIEKINSNLSLMIEKDAFLETKYYFSKLSKVIGLNIEL